MTGKRARLLPAVRTIVLAHYEANPIRSPTHPNFGADLKKLAAPPSLRPDPASSDDVGDDASEPIDLDLMESPPPAKRRMLPAQARVLPKPAVDDDDDDSFIVLSDDSPDSSPKRSKVSAPTPPAPSHPPAAPPPPSQPPSSQPPASQTGGPSPSKRGARTRTKPSNQLLARLTRAIQHPILIIDRSEGGRVFHILGATGSIYFVRICLAPSCTCPDFVKRLALGNRGPCKHLLYVMHRALKVEQHDARLYQVSLVEDELEAIFRDAPVAPGAELMANAAVCDKFRESQASQGEDEGEIEDCGVCLVEMLDMAACVVCGTCRKKLHGECMEKVVSHATGAAKCPLCRSAWVGTAVGGGPLNLALFSSQHMNPMTMEQLYPDTHEHMARRDSGRGRGGGRGRGVARASGANGRGRGRGARGRSRGRGA